MRRSRADVATGEELSVLEARRSQEAVRSRKKRKTILESFQSITLKSNCEQSIDGNSSCATGGSRNASHLVMHDDDTVSSSNSDEFLSDQEKVQRAMVYQLATGKTHGEKRSNIVLDRLEHIIRDSRMRAATASDDFHLFFGRYHEDKDMNIDAPPLKRSASLPKFFEGPAVPFQTIEIELNKEK